MLKLPMVSREKNSTVFAQANFGFIPKGAIGKRGPRKTCFVGHSTVGLSYEPEAQL